MTTKKILAVEYDGKRYEGDQLKRVMAEVPTALHSNIIVEYFDPNDPDCEDGKPTRARPFRFASEDASVGPDGVARLF